MPTRSRDSIPSLLIALALAACSSGIEAAGCHSDEACPAGSRCPAGVCVADARPVASIRPPGRVEAFALVQLDGSPSHDPDGGDDVVEHLWSIRAVAAPCDPPAIAGRTPTARVRFGCAGRYEIALAVRDALGVESEPATIELEVEPSTGAPAVIAGADLGSDHLCDGEPLRCRPTESISLSSSAPAGAGLRWTVEPPLDRRLDDGTRRVTFAPGPGAASPSVAIETDGTAISGDWIFRVDAYDAYGVVGTAHTRVSISNRAPLVVAGAPASVPHSFDAARSRFVAAGEVAYVAVDPDGDPLEVGAVLRHVGDGASAFAGELLDDRVTFSIEVPYERPEDALRLIGGADLERTVEIVAVDVNRVASRAAVPVTVANRPPSPVGVPGEVRAPHRFDATGARYVAVAELGAWTDPDGDPLSAAPAAAPCSNVWVASGIARVECSVPYEGSPAVHRIAMRHAVAVRVRDPWAEGPAPLQMVEVLNSAPRVTVSVAPATVRPLPGLAGVGFYSPDVRTCRNGRTSVRVPAISFVATPAVIDPDGDPVAVTPASRLLPFSASPRSAVCSEGSCVSFALSQDDCGEACPEDEPLSSLVASDGAATLRVGASPRILF